MGEGDSFKSAPKIFQGKIEANSDKLAVVGDGPAHAVYKFILDSALVQLLKNTCSFPQNVCLSKLFTGNTPRALGLNLCKICAPVFVLGIDFLPLTDFVYTPRQCCRTLGFVMNFFCSSLHFYLSDN